MTATVEWTVRQVAREVNQDPCTADRDCPRPLYDIRRGLCKTHYMGLYQRGELPPRPGVHELMAGRWRRVTDSGCWEWRGAISSEGYGKWSDLYVHRISVELTCGPIPDGLHVDHLCRNRRCFNPDHLEVVTHTENMRRGAQAHILTTGRCAAGHEMDEENTRLYLNKKGRTRRICRTCHRERARAAS